MESRVNNSSTENNDDDDLSKIRSLEIEEENKSLKIKLRQQQELFDEQNEHQIELELKLKQQQQLTELKKLIEGQNEPKRHLFENNVNTPLEPASYDKKLEQTQFNPTQFQPVIMGVPKFETFDGNTDVYDYLMEFDCVATAHLLSDYQKANYLYMNLSNEVKLLCSVLDANVKKDYKLMKSHLIKEYGKNKSYYWSEFNSRAPKINEKSKIFILSIQHLLSKAATNMPNEEKELLLTEKLTSYLPLQLVQQIKMFGEQTFKQICSRVESSLPIFAFNEDVYQKSSINMIQSNSFRETASNSNQKVCVYCDQSNHAFSECLKFKRMVENKIIDQQKTQQSPNRDLRKSESNSKNTRSRSNSPDNYNRRNYRDDRSSWNRNYNYKNYNNN